MESSPDESIFARTVPADGLACLRKLDHTPEFAPQTWGMLAPSPDCFKDSGDVVVIQDKGCSKTQWRVPLDAARRAV